MKAFLDSGWVSLASSAIIGAVATIISLSFWVSEITSRLDAEELAIQRMDRSIEDLTEMKERLARIEGKIDLIVSGRSLR